MHRNFSRRSLLRTGTGVLVATAVHAKALFSARKGGSTEMLDHILLGCADLHRGIDFMEKHTGVRAAFGGVHPGRGTQNALLSLGERHYLEIIALDPKQSSVGDHYGLAKLTEPRLVTWAAHPGDLDRFRTRLRDAKLAFDGPNPGSRKRPDGRLLEWKTLNLKEDYAGLLPFFIEWSADTVHPSVDAPGGCRLDSFRLLTPDVETLQSEVTAMGLGVEILKSEKAQLRAAISCAGKDLVLTS